MANNCIECGKEIKEDTDSPYCAKCDVKLDKQFETIEDNIMIYKELMPHEIDILNKFEKEDIIDLYIRVFDKFKSEGDFTFEQASVLNTLKSAFAITESEVGKDRIIEFKEEIINIAAKKDTCIDCGKKLQKDFNYCPYCGSKVVI